MGRHGGVVCAARVVMGPPPGLWRVHHTHTAVFSHATEVTSLRTTRTQGTVKRRYRVHTEPSLASNLCVTLPGQLSFPPDQGHVEMSVAAGAAMRQWHEEVMG